FTRCLLLAAPLFIGCAGHPPLAVVPDVDLNRYTGTWYEIAKYPASFEKNCHGAWAEYSLRRDGKIDVTNRCFDGSLSGPERKAAATARVVGPAEPAKLAVSFFWPFEGQYWIIDLD